MFNPEAEVFVILYPHGAGGRFLQSVMCLDTTIVSIALESTSLKSENLFGRIKEYVSNNVDSHIDKIGHLSAYDPGTMKTANRYVFCVHQSEYGSAIEFLKSCTNLKIIVMTMESTESIRLLDNRRKFLGRNIPDEVIRNSYKVREGEFQFLKNFNESINSAFGVPPCLTIEVDQYWDPEIAIPVINNFFAEQKINCENWEELYHLWLANSINVWKK